MKVKFLNRDVTWMRTNDLEQYRTNDDFMKAYAERKGLFENIQIATNDTTSFVKDLESHGIIEFIKNRLFVSFKKNNKFSRVMRWQIPKGLDIVHQRKD